MKIPFGLRVLDQRMVAPTEVPRGAACGCECPGCGRQLVANHGEIKRPYFSHAKGADCATAVESAIHRMAKQRILDHRSIWLPSRILERRVLGPLHEETRLPSWEELFRATVQDEGLLLFDSCDPEVTVGERRPDILATLAGGGLLAIEIAVTHFCDEEKCAALRAANLTTLELNLSDLLDMEPTDVMRAIELRLFSPSKAGRWLYHSGDERAQQELAGLAAAAQERYAEADATFKIEQSRLRAERARKKAFMDSIADLESRTFSVGDGITLHVAVSRVRCTLKGRGYFFRASPAVKRFIGETARKFGARFNSNYKLWEVYPPVGQVQATYSALLKYIQQNLHDVLPGTKYPVSRPRSSDAGNSPLSEPIVAETLSLVGLDADEQIQFAERAAILHFEGGATIAVAEAMAFEEILRQRVRSDFEQ